MSKPDVPAQEPLERNGFTILGIERARAMKLDEALAVWAYMQHRDNPSVEAKRAADEAWRVIGQEAIRIIYPALTPSE